MYRTLTALSGTAETLADSNRVLRYVPFRNKNRRMPSARNTGLSHLGNGDAAESGSIAAGSTR
jgi:hypothetical protein